MVTERFKSFVKVRNKKQIQHVITHKLRWLVPPVRGDQNSQFRAIDHLRADLELDSRDGAFTQLETHRHPDLPAAAAEIKTGNSCIISSSTRLKALRPITEFRTRLEITSQAKKNGATDSSLSERLERLRGLENKLERSNGMTMNELIALERDWSQTDPVFVQELKERTSIDVLLPCFDTLIWCDSEGVIYMPRSTFVEHSAFKNSSIQATRIEFDPSVMADVSFMLNAHEQARNSLIRKRDELRKQNV